MMASSLRRCDCFLLAAEWHLEDKMSEPVPVNWTHKIIRSVKVHLINLFIINLMIYYSDQSDIVQQRRMSNLSSCFLLQEQWEEGRGSEETTTWVVRELSDGRVGRIGPGCVLQIKFHSDEFKVQRRYKASASLRVSFWPESRTEGIGVVSTGLLPVQVLLNQSSHMTEGRSARGQVDLFRAQHEDFKGTVVCKTCDNMSKYKFTAKDLTFVTTSTVRGSGAKLKKSLNSADFHSWSLLKTIY